MCRGDYHHKPTNYTLFLYQKVCVLPTRTRVLHRVVLFEQPNETTYVTISFFSLFIDQKKWREKNEERE